MAEADGMAPRGSTRRDPRLLFWAAGLLLVARVASGMWADRHPAPRHDLVQWRPGIEAQAESRRSGKPILYDFTAEWCGPCQTLGTEVFADPACAKRINDGFIPVRVTDRRQEDGRNPAEVDALQKRYGVEAFPTLVIVPPRGGEPMQQRGYGGKAETMAWLDSAAPPPAPSPKR